MKVLKNQQNYLSSLPNDSVKVVLFYGKDLGLISYYSAIVCNNLIAKGFSKESFYSDDIKNNHMLLENALQSDDLFAQGSSSKLVVVKGDFPKLITSIKGLLPHMKDVLLVIEGGDLQASSKIRQFCDKENNCVSIPCYQETTTDLIKNILLSLKHDGYTIEQEALNYTASKLGNNKMVTEQEIAKLKLYKLNDKNITLQDTMLIIGQNDNIAIDKIINACFSGSLNNLLPYLEVETLKTIGAVPIVRSLISHCLKLITIKLLLREKNDFEKASSLVKPVIFYKQKLEIKSYINKWSLKTLFDIYNDLITQEIMVKKNNSIAEIILQNIFIKLSSLVKK